MERFVLNRTVTFKKLLAEVEALNLPGFIGMGVFTREIDENGRAILDKDGKIIHTAPFMIVKSSDLNTVRKEAVSAVITSHVKDAPVPVE